MIRVLTYNIHGAKGTDGKRNYARIGEFLKAQDIQVALIQELDTRRSRPNTEQEIADLKTDHFSHVALAPTLVNERGWYGNAIFSKFPIVKETIIDITYMKREPRNILEVFIETPGGLLHVVNTHKGLDSMERHHQMTRLHELLSHKSEVPLIVGGDINQWHPRSEALRELNQVLHPIDAGATFPSRFPIFHLDRLWCRPFQLIQNSQVVKTAESKRYSDHLPLLAEIKL